MPQSKEARRAVTKRYYKKNKEAIIAYGKKYRLEMRLYALEHYGGKCACCGEQHLEFLSIDHIEGGGNVHRREISGGNKNFAGWPFLLWLKRNNWPAGFQVLCNNCNMAKAFYDVCPHKRKWNRVTLGSPELAG